jgi:hypothetical protein
MGENLMDNCVNIHSRNLVYLGRSVDGPADSMALESAQALEETTMENVTDPIGFLTTIALGMLLVCALIGLHIAYEFRDVFAKIVKTIVGRYFVFRWHGINERQNVLSSPPTEDDCFCDDEPAFVNTLPDVTNAFAKAQNPHNSAVVHCAAIVALAETTNTPLDIMTAQIETLARLIVGAKKADTTPKIGETDAIKYGLNIKPGGSNPLYDLARAALKAEVARQKGEAPASEIVGFEPDPTNPARSIPKRQPV